jgi:hypothetical protein
VSRSGQTSRNPHEIWLEPRCIEGRNHPRGVPARQACVIPTPKGFLMERVATLAAGALAATLLVSAVPLATALRNGTPGLHQRKADVRPAGRSPMKGSVQLTRDADAGTVVQVVLRGLEPGADYATFFSETTDCSSPGEILGSAFTADAEGHAQVRTSIGLDLENVGSVSIRSGPSYSVVFGCARMR